MKSQHTPPSRGIIDQGMEKFKMTKRTAKDYSKINPKEISLKNHLNEKNSLFSIKNFKTKHRDSR